MDDANIITLLAAVIYVLIKDVMPAMSKYRNRDQSSNGNGSKTLIEHGKDLEHGKGEFKEINNRLDRMFDVLGLLRDRVTKLEVELGGVQDSRSRSHTRLDELEDTVAANMLQISTQMGEFRGEILTLLRAKGGK